MNNSDNVTVENTIRHDLYCIKISDQPCRILTIGGSRLEKQRHYFIWYGSICETIYQFWINNSESKGLKQCNHRKAFIKYWNDMNDIYKNINEYNLNKRIKILIALDNMIAE